MKTFVEYIESSIRKNWELKAFTDYQEETLTYADVAHEITKLQFTYKKLGVKKGDKIAQIGKNNSKWAITFLSTVSYGAVSVPILQDFTQNDIEHIVNHSDSILLFISDSIFEKIDISKLPNVIGFISLDSFNVLWAANPKVATAINEMQNSNSTASAETFTLEAIPHNQLASISYTSGTSGLSKGVMLSHQNFATNLEFGHYIIDLKPNDTIVSFLPLAHAYGLAFELLVEFTMGCHITFLGKIPSPQIILQVFNEIKPRLVVVVPLIIEKIYKTKVKPAISEGLPKFLLGMPLLRNVVYKKVRKQLDDAFGGNFIEVIIGGAALNKEVESFLIKIGFRFAVGYGMTECAPLISFSSWDNAQKFSCGQKIQQCEVKIDSPDPENIEGEILVKGPQVMMGYYKNPQASAETFDDEGWLKTGDLGVMNNQGYITIKGRSKNMILGASGQNIYPEEIEARLNSMPYVMESLVVEKDGKLHALIVPDKEKAERDGLDKEAVKLEFDKSYKQLNQQMPNYMNIARVEIQEEEFIKTAKKSIKRFLYTN